MLDSGAFGNIEKASYHGSKVAVKYVKPGGSKALAQTFREVKLEVHIVKQLKHPSIVSFYGVAVKFPKAGEDVKDWTLGLVFELCEGGQLNKLLHTKDNQPNHRFTSAQKFKMAKDVSIGIAYLHSLRCIHRDLSTRNLLLMGDQQVKICDFGCARQLHQESYSSTTISGSPPWMAPEQIMGGQLTLKADVFSFGTILWELATEKIPHFDVRDSMEAIRHAVCVRGLVPKLPGSQDMADVPQGLKTNFDRLLVLLHQHVPYHRPNADQVRQVIESFEEALNADSRDPAISPNAKGIDGTEHEKLLQELEERVHLGERLIRFYQRYNSGRVQQLSSVLDQYFGREEDLCAEMRRKYNADLNGEYPPPTESRPLQPANELGAAQGLDDGNVGASASHADTNVVEHQIFISRLMNFYSINDPSLMSSVEDKARSYAGREEQFNSILRDAYNGCDLNDPEGLRFPHRHFSRAPSHSSRLNQDIPPPQTYEQMHHAYPAHPEFFPGMPHEDMVRRHVETIVMHDGPSEVRMLPQHQSRMPRPFSPRMESLRGGPVPMMREDIGPQQITVTTRRIVDVPHEQPAMRVAGLGVNGVSGLPGGSRVVKTTKYPPGHQPPGMGVSLGTTQQISLGNPQQIPFGSPAPHRAQSTVSTISTTMSMSSPSRAIDQHILKNLPPGSQIVGGGTPISHSPMMGGHRHMPPPPPMMGPGGPILPGGPRMGPPPMPGAQLPMGVGRPHLASPIVRF